MPAEAVIIPASPPGYVQKASPCERVFAINIPPDRDIKKFTVIAPRVVGVK